MNTYKKYPKYKDSGIEWLGEIPEHWEVMKLKYIANCFPSNVDKHTRENEKKVRLCNYTDVYYNDFIYDYMELMHSSANDEQIKKFSLLKGDIVITKDESAELVEKNQDKLLLDARLKKRFSGKRYLVLIAVEDFEEIPPFKIDRSEYGNMDDWLPVEDIDKVKAK